MSCLPSHLHASGCGGGLQCVYVCILCVFNHLDRLTMTPHGPASGWPPHPSITAHVTAVSLVVFFLRVLTSEGDSVCLGVAILCTVMCFLGFITSCPNLLSCFVSSCLPPSPPLSYCSPPTGCAFVTFATRAMAQNAIKTMHHSQTMEVLYPSAHISHFPSFPLIHAAAPLCCNDEEPVRVDGVRSSESMGHF